MLSLMLLLTLCGRAAADEEVAYVLEPGAQPLVSEIFERMKPALRYTEGAIERDSVTARLCREAAGACFDVRLEHPASADCGPTTWGPFCVRFLSGPPPHEVRAAIADALSASTDGPLWTKLVRSTPAPLPPLPRSVVVSAAALGTSVALTLVPLGTGLLLGGAVRRLLAPRRSGAWVATAAVVAPAIAALLLDTGAPLVGAWDALYVGVAIGIGLAVALRRAGGDAKNLVLLFGGSFVGLIGLEAACRFLLPPPPAFPTAGAPTLFVSQTWRSPRQAYSTTFAGLAVCDAVYADVPTVRHAGTAFPATWQPRRDAREHVLHLGDSMVFGSDRPRFTDRLNELEPSVEHVNAAIAGTAPDAYLALLQRFLATRRLTAVVMHLTPNDYAEVDQRQYPCSGWQPLLAYGPSGPRLRFPTDRPHSGEQSRLAWLMQNSPPPYVLRSAVGFSSAAAHLAAASVHLGRRLGYMYGDEDDGVREAHLAAILRTARDNLAERRIPFVVDILRDRSAVESRTPTEVGWDDRLKRIAMDAGIVTIDTWEPLVAAVQRGEDVYMSPQDPHFNDVGHALVAAWLHRELGAAIAEAAGRIAGGLHP